MVSEDDRTVGGLGAVGDPLQLARGDPAVVAVPEVAFRRPRAFEAEEVDAADLNLIRELSGRVPVDEATAGSRPMVVKRFGDVVVAGD